ncbi:MAG: hypothetical protein R3B47_19185 [Bacteroidia bacterium]
MNKGSPYPIFLTVMLLLGCWQMACSSQASQTSLAFSALFPNQAFDFRNVNLGMPLDSVRKAESMRPVSEDLLGLSYRLDLRNLKEAASLEYYFPENRELDALRAIVVNLRFRDTRQAELLYRDCQHLFNKKYGPSVSGSQGQESWQESHENGLLEAHLRLSELESVLSINILLIAGK